METNLKKPGSVSQLLSAEENILQSKKTEFFAKILTFTQPLHGM
jgi:hypothetical protein